LSELKLIGWMIKSMLNILDRSIDGSIHKYGRCLQLIGMVHRCPSAKKRCALIGFFVYESVKRRRIEPRFTRKIEGISDKPLIFSTTYQAFPAPNDQKKRFVPYSIRSIILASGRNQKLKNDTHN
jgi:hypothetical protein